jgi:hypothetical protein
LVFQRSIGEVLPGLGTLLAAIAIIGLLTQAIIQTAKDLFPLRFYLQRMWFKRWLVANAAKAGRLAPPDVKLTPTPESVVETDMIELATSGDQKAFYSSPIEQLCGQLNAALRAALESPARHRILIATFAVGAKFEDLIEFFKDPPPPSSTYTSPNANPEFSPDARAAIKAFADARNRVAHHVERTIDGLQISVGSKWKRLLQISSYSLSFAFALLGVGMYWHAPSFFYGLRDVFVAGFLAGYVAPIVRDILARVQQRTV